MHTPSRYWCACSGVSSPGMPAAFSAQCMLPRQQLILSLASLTAHLRVLGALSHTHSASAGAACWQAITWDVTTGSLTALQRRPRLKASLLSIEASEGPGGLHTCKRSPVGRVERGCGPPDCQGWRFTPTCNQFYLVHFNVCLDAFSSRFFMFNDCMN